MRRPVYLTYDELRLLLSAAGVYVWDAPDGERERRQHVADLLQRLLSGHPDHFPEHIYEDRGLNEGEQ